MVVTLVNLQSVAARVYPAQRNTEIESDHRLTIFVGLAPAGRRERAGRHGSEIRSSRVGLGNVRAVGSPHVPARSRGGTGAAVAVRDVRVVRYLGDGERMR